MSISFVENRLFAALRPEIASELSDIPEIVSYSDGSIVFDEGDVADYVYLVASGCIQISKRGRGGQQENLTTIEPGDFFGEMAMYDLQPRSARATATQHTVLGRVDTYGFARMLERAPVEISRNLTRAVIERLRRTDEHWIRSMLQAERLSLVGTMVDSIIHEFKNSLNRLGGVAQFLKERRDDPELISWAGMIDRATASMVRLMDELYDYSKGKTDLTLTSVQVDDLVDDLEEETLKHLPEKGIHVVREIAYRGAIEADRVRLGRALLNLIKNSAEAMLDGGTLTLRTELRADGVAFVVSDTGKGIPPELRPHIFEPFVTAGKENGTGLGMAIVKTIIDAHQGTISLASVVNVGTRVEIVLPNRNLLAAE